MEKEQDQKYQEKKQHGSKLFPFNIYPCTIPLDFPSVSLHWHKEMELIYVKKEEERSNWRQICFRERRGIFLWFLRELFMHCIKQRVLL